MSRSKSSTYFRFFPITRFRTAQFLASHVPGIHVPQIWLDNLKTASLKNEDEEEQIGFEMSLKLFKDLYKLHPKIHIMTANRFDLAKKYWRVKI